MRTIHAMGSPLSVHIFNEKRPKPYHTSICGERFDDHARLVDDLLVSCGRCRRIHDRHAENYVVDILPDTGWACICGHSGSGRREAALHALQSHPAGERVVITLQVEFKTIGFSLGDSA
jgi:hypothetical protein